MNSNAVTLVALLALSSFVAGCDEEKPAEAPKEESAAPALPEKSAEEKAAEEKAAVEAAKKAEEAAAAEAKLQADPLTECCRALGQKGFMERSPEFMAASKVCGDAMGEKKELKEILPDIEKELKGKTTPDACKP